MQFRDILLASATQGGGGVAAAGISSWQIIGEYGEIGFNSQVVSSGAERQFTRIPIITAINITAIQVLNGAFYVDGSGVEQAISNDQQVGHGYIVDGACIGSDAARTTVTAGQGGVLSSLLTANIAAGKLIWLNREVDAPSGGGQGYQTIPYTAGAQYGGYGRKTMGLGSTDLTTVSPASLILTTYRQHPRAVLGYGVHGYTFAVLGDSIAYNNTDTNFGDGGEVGQDSRTLIGGAWVRRSFKKAGRLLGSEIPLAMSARASAVLANVGTARRAIYPYTSVLIFQIGTNDIVGGGKTAAQLDALVEAEIVLYKAAFSAANPLITPKAIVCTLIPRQSTPTGTTSNAELIEYNRRVRHGEITGADGYLDPNAFVASLSDESIWLDGATDSADGTHPTTTGHFKISEGVYPTLMLAQPWLTFLP